MSSIPILDEVEYLSLVCLSYRIVLELLAGGSDYFLVSTRKQIGFERSTREKKSLICCGKHRRRWKMTERKKFVLTFLLCNPC